MNALLNNTTGTNNTATGYQALQSNTGGTANTANGVNALLNNTTGENNTGVGFQVLLNATVGVGNTATGFQDDSGVERCTPGDPSTFSAMHGSSQACGTRRDC